MACELKDLAMHILHLFTRVLTGFSDCFWRLSGTELYLHLESVSLSRLSGFVSYLDRTGLLMSHTWENVPCLFQCFPKSSLRLDFVVRVAGEVTGTSSFFAAGH